MWVYDMTSDGSEESQPRAERAREREERESGERERRRSRSAVGILGAAQTRDDCGQALRYWEYILHISLCTIRSLTTLRRWLKTSQTRQSFSDPDIIRGSNQFVHPSSEFRSHVDLKRGLLAP